MQSGRGGMGSHKHSVHGVPTKNARYKAQSLREDWQEIEYKKKRQRLKPPMRNVSVRSLIGWKE